MENSKDLRADAQYLREFYEWNKKRHPEWNGEYVLKIAEEKETKARHLRYEVPIDEYWVKLRDLLRKWWKAYTDTHPYSGWFWQDREAYCAEFLKSLKELNLAIEFFGNKKAEWLYQTERYAISINRQSTTHEIYLYSLVAYKDEEEGKIHYYSTGHLDADSIVGIIGKEVKYA